ncbi:MAG: lysozyme [Pseudomonadota bacterium]
MLKGSFSAFFTALFAGAVLLIAIKLGFFQSQAIQDPEAFISDLDLEQTAKLTAPIGVLPENANLRTNQAGIDIIKESEGLRLEAYQLGGQWLIGYGHSRTARAGMVISARRAEELLRDDLRDFEEGVKRLLTVPVNRNEFSAMVSLAYNLGIGGFKKTAVLERVNAGDRQGAADAFLRHNRARVNGTLKPIPHLTERRAHERALFLKPV